jgi:hypothetical protein
MAANAVPLGLLEPPISGQLSKYRELWFTESSVVSPRHKLRHRCGRHQNGSSLSRALACNLYFSAMDEVLEEDGDLKKRMIGSR